MINAHPFMFFPTLFFLQSNNGSSVHYPSILLFFFLFLFLLLHIFLKSKIHFISFHMPSLTLEEEKKIKKNDVNDNLLSVNGKNSDF